MAADVDTEGVFGLDGLDDGQREAVVSTEGFVRVVAGAGSGKTRALTHRFVYLTTALGVPPSHILCVTFSNKSANEMRQRIHKMTGDNDTGFINTFHGFCVSVLHEDGHAIGYPKNFIVLDNSDIDRMLKLIYEERGLSLRDMTFSQARDKIEIRKTITEPTYHVDLASFSAEELRCKYEAAEKAFDIIFYGYLWQEKKCFGLDYNDLIVLTLRIFGESPEICIKWRKRLEYIMIDEFQDIDPLQYRLMETLCAYHRNLFVVGDPDQTIYTWRGASVRYLLDFDRKFSPCQTVMMMRNYRSTPQIVAAANSLISRNSDRIAKVMEPVLPDGPRPIFYQGKNPDDEAGWVAARILELKSKGVSLSGMTVLYRAHYVTRALEDAFAKSEIPYTIYSGVQFFDRTEIKDALSYLRLIAFRDDLSFERVANTPKRDIGERRMAFLRSMAEENHISLYEALTRSLDNELFKRTKARDLVKLVEEFSATYSSRPVSELLSAVLDASGYERMLRTEGGQTRLDNLAELKQSIYDYETSCGEECTLELYLSHVALFTNRDAVQVRDSVKLMTVHTAKGLEFPYLFLVSMNEGVFPSKKTETREGMEEERRLAFVALTRAERALFISSSGGRGFDGSPRYPSRFVLDVEKELIEFETELCDDLIKEMKDWISGRDKTSALQAAGASFAIGERVVHPVLGPGLVISIDEGTKAYEVKFDRLPTPRTVSFRVVLTHER